MIQSMTGFGKAVTESGNKKISVEIKSLNSKQLDLSVRIPNLYREKEMEMRNIILKRLVRGKVDLLIYIENLGTDVSSKINGEVVSVYYGQIQKISEKSGIKIPEDILSAILKLPDTIKAEYPEVDEQEWEAVKKALWEALDQLDAFRNQEGEMLRKLFVKKAENIAVLLGEINLYEKERVESIKVKMQDALSKLDVPYDHNRFEEEMIYYIEKLDINEEKNRLDNHLKYFLHTLEEEEDRGQGKKLGFIAQEMGREINTMGSKSNHAEMQKIVVKMKDELEQIKEQIFNVL